MFFLLCQKGVCVCVYVCECVCVLLFTKFTYLTLRPQAARLLRSWVRIPPGAWIFVCCDCRVLSGRGLCDELITRPEESYRLCCVVVCDLETSRMGAPYIYIYIYDISRLRVNLLYFGAGVNRSVSRRGNNA